ncbi:MAG: FG-GAP-like repeat-containing protein, partial [Elusimicrobiota bacterium]
GSDPEIVGGTTSGWNMEVLDKNGGLIWSFPSPAQLNGQFMWHSSPAADELKSDSPGFEIVAGNNPKSSVWCFAGRPDGTDRGISVASMDPERNPNNWGYPTMIGVEGVDWDVLWVSTADGAVIATPAIADLDNDGQKDVVASSTKGVVYALNGSNGALKWKFTASSSIYSSAGIGDLDGDGLPEVVIAADNGAVYALTGSSGGVKWSFAIGASTAMWSSPALADLDGDSSAEVVIGAGNGRVYAVSGSSGAVKWSYAAGASVRSSPALARRNTGEPLSVYVGDEAGRLHVINGATGARIDTMFFSSGSLRTSPAVADIDGDGRLELAYTQYGQIGDNDTFRILRDNGSAVASRAQPWPLFRGNPARTGSLIPVVSTGPLPIPGCAVTRNVKKDGSGDHASIQAAVDALSKTLTGDACVVVRDAQTYNEQVTVQGFTNNGYRLKIMADPGFTSSAPVVSPPPSSAAAFLIKNASVSLQGFSILAVSTVPYAADGVSVSSGYADISRVRVEGGGFNGAGIRLSGWSALSESAVSVLSADGIVLTGSGNTVFGSSATAGGYVVVSGPTRAALRMAGASSNTISGSFLSGGPGWGHGVIVDAASVG